MQPELIGGRYRVEAAIGQGGMGTVWLCRDETLARDVAVKQVGLLPGESVTDSARALREARSSAALSHRNVVTVFDVVEESGHIWMVMENVPSRSLSDIIRAEGALDPEQVARIGAQVADGLASAHAAGITHRDVKPGNVLVRDDGVAKISDFGIARTAGDPALTQSGLFIGTPTYFSPELARGAEPDPSADVWALGATLYAAVEGRPPYEQKTNAMAVLSEIANDPPPPPKRAGFLEPALRRMLDSDAKSRWSMADAAHALHQLAERHSHRTRTATTAPPQRTSPPPDPEPSRRRRGVLLPLLVVAAVLLAGGIGYALTNDADPADSAESGDAPAAGTREPSATPSESRDPDAATPTDRSAAAGSPGQVAFLEDYFTTVPDDLDAGWSMLSPGMKSVGRDSYEGFWGSVSSVRASRFSPRGDTVDLTLRYTMDDGRVSVERHRIELVRGNGGYLIDDDTPIG